MNALFKLYRLMDQTNGDGGDAGGGGVVDDNANKGDGGNAADGANKEEKPAPVTVENMADAITKGLAGEETDPAKAAVKPGDKVLTAEEQATETQRLADQKITDDAAAEKKIKDDAAAATKALAEKKPDDPDLQLSDDEKKVIGPKAQARFQKLTEYGKTQFARAETTAAQNGELIAARDNIMSLLTDSKTEPDELGRLLNFNYLIKTRNFDEAIKTVELYRTELYKLVGKEAPGVDLLTGHDDLVARVKNAELSRDDALVIANARKVEKQNNDHTQQQQNTQEQRQEVQRAQDEGMAGIEAWVKKMSVADIDFKAKEAKISAEVAGIIKDYAPHQWVATIDRLYRATTVAKAVVLPNPKDTPLRPSGGGGGTKEAKTMLDAISGGLGYATGN